MIEGMIFLVVWWLWEDEPEKKRIGWVELPWKGEVWNPDAQVTVRVVKKGEK